MENTECLVRGRLAGIGPVTAGALKASHPKPGLTATCWAKPTLLLSKPSLWKINVPNKTWTACQIFIVFKVQIQERKRCPREIRCGKTVYLSAAISWRGRGHRKGAGGVGGQGRRETEDPAWEKKKKKAWSISNCLCVSVWNCTLSSSGRQRGTLCSSLTMVMKSLSCRSSSLVLHSDRGWYCKKIRGGRQREV